MEKINLAQKGHLTYSDLMGSIQGWFGYAIWAETYKLREHIIKLIAADSKTIKTINYINKHIEPLFLENEETREETS